MSIRRDEKYTTPTGVESVKGERMKHEPRNNMMTFRVCFFTIALMAISTSGVGAATPRPAPPVISDRVTSYTSPEVQEQPEWIPPMWNVMRDCEPDFDVRVASAKGSALDVVPTDLERAIVEVAQDNCGNQRKRSGLDIWLALKLVRIEGDEGLPASARGITLAAWCGEASYKTNPRDGDGGNAVGIMQLHRWHAEACGSLDIRDDPESAVRCYLRRVKRLVPKALKLCGKEMAWPSAEAWAAQGQQGYTCRDSGHWTRLRTWKPLILKAMSRSSKGH